MATVAASPHISFAAHTMPHLTARRQGRAGQPHSERGWEARGRTHKWSLVGKVAEDKMFGTSAGLFNAMGAISGQVKSRRDDARASKSLIFGILPCCAPPRAPSCRYLSTARTLSCLEKQKMPSQERAKTLRVRFIEQKWRRRPHARACPSLATPYPIWRREGKLALANRIRRRGVRGSRAHAQASCSRQAQGLLKATGAKSCAPDEETRGRRSQEVIGVRHPALPRPHPQPSPLSVMSRVWPVPLRPISKKTIV